MKKKVGFTFLLLLPLTGLSFSQQPKKTTAPEGVFAYAINAKQLVVIDKDIDESNARLLTKAVCPTHMIASVISLTAIRKGIRDGTSEFQYDADSEVPANDYCLLVDAKAHERLFVWGSGDSPVFVHEKKCLNDIVKAEEDLTGRKVVSCYLIGGYGTGRLELLEYASQSPDDRLAALMVIDDSLDDGPRYSIVRFPASSPIWAVDNDGKFHPERFRYLFTVSDDPDSKLWSVAIEWKGQMGRDLTLYRPVGSQLKPVIANRDSSGHEDQGTDIALR